VNATGLRAGFVYSASSSHHGSFPGAFPYFSGDAIPPCHGWLISESGRHQIKCQLPSTNPSVHIASGWLLLMIGFYTFF
jgi:hypothetical protein